MLELVAKTITRYSMFQPGQRVGAAVSGGADSVCLLHVLRDLAPRWNLRLTVLHLDHQLRGEESRQDAAFVRDLAAALDLPCESQETDVAALCRETGENLEQAARAARLQFFQRLIRGGTVDRIATGHTRSDQAETVLFRFLRGSGTAGLAGIRPVTHEAIVRPLLEIDRAAVEHYLRERGIAWRTDSTNASSAFARNRIRHELLPQLTRDWNPALAETLAHTADWAQAEEAYWESELARLAPAHLVFDPPAVLLRVDAMADLPLAAGAPRGPPSRRMGQGRPARHRLRAPGGHPRIWLLPPKGTAASRSPGLISFGHSTGCASPRRRSITWITAIIGYCYRYPAPSGCPAVRR